MKKSIRLFGVLCSLSFFCACGGSNGDGSDTSTGSRSEHPDTAGSVNSTSRPDTTQGLRTGQGDKELSDTAQNR